MKTTRIAMTTLLATLLLSAISSAGEQLSFVWTDVEDEYYAPWFAFIMEGYVDTPAAGETTEGENIIMITRPGLPDQQVTVEEIDSGGHFFIIGDDPAEGANLPTGYGLIAYDSANNWGTTGGVVE